MFNFPDDSLFSFCVIELIFLLETNIENLKLKKSIFLNIYATYVNNIFS